MTNPPTRAAGLWLAVLLAAGVCATPLAAARSRGVSIDAKEAELAFVLNLLSSGTSAKLTPHPDVAKERVTFAAKSLTRTAAVRWLCRTCGLVAARGKGGQVVVGKIASAEAIVKSYKAAALAPTGASGEAMAAFIRSVMFRAFPGRESDDEGKLAPKLAVKWEKGRLKVLAPAMVQREVLALLQAMARAKAHNDVLPLSVKYEPYDLGFLRTTAGAEPPPMKGNISVKLAGASAAEAAWELTTRSKVSFYADPWDPGLQEASVTLEAKEQPLSAVAEKVAAALDAELFGYDGAWLLVRASRRPLYESLVVRVYNVSGDLFGRSIADVVERRVRRIELPEGLPFALERVGGRFLLSAPGSTHKQFGDTLKLMPRGPGGRPWRDRLPPGIRRRFR